MISKERIGAKWKRVFEKVSKTPYQRVIERNDVLEEKKIKLIVEHSKLNPLELKQELDRLKSELNRKLAKIEKIR